MDVGAVAAHDPESLMFTSGPSFGLIGYRVDQSPHRQRLTSVMRTYALALPPSSNGEQRHAAATPI